MRLLALLTPALLALALLGCGSSTSPDETALPYPDVTGLVAFYQFNGDLTDAGPDSLTAASARDPIYIGDHDGAAESAVYVDGTADTIWVPTRGAFDLVGEFTLAAWIRADIPPYAYASIIDKGYFEGAYSLGVPGRVEPGTTPLTLYVADEQAYVSDAVPMGTGEWVHVACTFSDSTDTAEFFVNGASLGSSGQEGELGVTGYDLRIGTSQWRDAFRGGLDQVAIFDRVLTPDEIVELYEFD
jgi:hypothetical protein